jgi:hypothetical protein
MTHFKSKRSFEFQRLEDRMLMAGNVVAAVNKGTLTLTGDNFDNGIVVTSGPQIGQIYISPVAGSNTTINGQTSPVLLSGVSKDLVANMNGGNDVLEVLDTGGIPISLPGKINVNMGAGNDYFYAYNARTTDSVSINAGTGSDAVILERVKIGNQNVNHNHNDLSITGQGGTDTFYIDNTTVARNLTIDDHKATGDDTVALLNSSVGGNVSVQTGNADDFVSGDHLSVGGQMKVSTNSGDDHVYLYYSNIDKLMVQLGDGDDELYLRNDSAKSTDFDGGKGFDWLDQANNSFGQLKDKNFERFDV